MGSLIIKTWCRYGIILDLLVRQTKWTQSGLQIVFQSVIMAKLLHASSAWSGFATAADRQRVNAFLRRSKQWGFCRPDTSMFEVLLENSDQQLFRKIMNIVCYRHPHQLHNTTNFDSGHTTENCQTILAA